MSEYKTIQVKTMNCEDYLNYLRENQCINCYNFRGEEHDYNSRVCERCVSRATAGEQFVFEFLPSGIVECQAVKCLCCKEEFTDYVD